MLPTEVENVLDTVQKDITTSNTMAQAGDTGLSRQDLQSGITKLSNRNTPLRDRLKRKKGNGLAHAWNVRSIIAGVKPVDTVYSESGLGSTNTPTYNQRSAAYKQLGQVGIVSNLALAAGASFTDLEAEVTEAVTRAVIQAEEWLNYHGDSTFTNANSVTSYDGLDKQIKSNAISLGGALSNTDPIDEAFQRIASNGGGPGNYAIFVSPGILRKINQILQGSGAITRVVTEDGQNIPFGLQATYYPSIFGPVPLIWDYFVNPQGNAPYPYNVSGSSSTSGATTSSIYVLNLDYIAMVDLKPLGKEPLYMTSADNTRFLVNEYTVMEVTAEEFSAVITGVNEPTY